MNTFTTALGVLLGFWWLTIPCGWLAFMWLFKRKRLAEIKAEREANLPLYKRAKKHSTMQVHRVAAEFPDATLPELYDIIESKAPQDAD